MRVTLSSLGLRLLAGSLGLVLVSAGPQGCGGRQAPVRQAPDTLTSDALRQSILRQVGSAACSSPAVCRTLPLGSKPCGGPREYLVYSLSVTDSARLAAEAARYNRTDAERNREKGLVSDCRMLLEPRVICVSGRCAAVRSERQGVY